MDFYLGTIWVSGRADLSPVYRIIFRRLRARGLDWVYHFPRLRLIDMRPLRDALQAKGEPEWAKYDPESALAKEQADREIAEFRAQLDEDHWEAVEKATHEPPPATVQAYETVYGRLPRGWPPSA